MSEINTNKIIGGNYSAPRLGHINFGQNGENKISVLP